MDLKFYLNKIVKIDNIEHYSLSSLKQIKKLYDQFLETTGGFDPDYPMIDFSGGKGKSTQTMRAGNNKYQIEKNQDTPEEFNIFDF